MDWTASDGLKSTIVAALSLAVSGMGLSHSDIGGFFSFIFILFRSFTGGFVSFRLSFPLIFTRLESQYKLS